MKKILRFTASWCGPCKMLSKVLEDMTLPVPLEVVDIDEKPELAQQFGVRGVPTMVLVNGDIEVARLVGMKMANEITEFANK